MDIILRTLPKICFWPSRGFMAQIRHLKRVKNAVAWVHFEDFFGFKVLLNTRVIARKWVLDVFPTFVGVKR